MVLVTGVIGFISLSCPLRKSDILKMFWKAQRSIKRFRAAKSFFEQKEGAQTKELGIDSQLNVESAGYIVFNYLQKQIENSRCSTFDDNKTTKMPHIPEKDLKILKLKKMTILG